MSDLPAFIAENVLWRQVLHLAEQGDSPHSLALSAPSHCHESLARQYGMALLGSSSRSLTDPEGFLADFLPCGSLGTPPGIDDCRRLWRELSLFPVCAPWRLGVIFEADHLSLPAANSLLKMTEEPPPRGRLLFLLDDGELIPTLKSRCWNISLKSTDNEEPLAPPKEAEEWAQWLRQPGKTGLDPLLDLRQWTAALLREEAADLACSLESVRLIAERAKLSPPMVHDLTYLVLKEDLSLEQIFSDIW